MYDFFIGILHFVGVAQVYLSILVSPSLIGAADSQNSMWVPFQTAAGHITALYKGKGHWEDIIKVK